MRVCGGCETPRAGSRIGTNLVMLAFSCDYAHPTAANIPKTAKARMPIDRNGFIWFLRRNEPTR